MTYIYIYHISIVYLSPFVAKHETCIVKVSYYKVCLVYIFQEETCVQPRSPRAIWECFPFILTLFGGLLYVMRKKHMELEGNCEGSQSSKHAAPDLVETDDPELREAVNSTWNRSHSSFISTLPLPVLLYPNEYSINHPIYQLYHMISHANLLLSPPVSFEQVSRLLEADAFTAAHTGRPGCSAKVAWHIGIFHKPRVCVCVCVSGRVKENRKKDVEPHYTDIDKYLSIYDNWWYYVILQQQKLSKPGYPLKFHEIKLLSLRL